jgi:hypothetical protein
MSAWLEIESAVVDHRRSEADHVGAALAGVLEIDDGKKFVG